ncbi:uncharacterized protein LOC110829415 isoform X2 [Zootermopsis nevadensis]|uniref:Uncharacterized protein n=1 Tax=Zootermopsis nevadensis TaxID=136037 RepID=A0A067R8R8_ZOONE|nr:uncharacterized protein LOC110829415 isoform X2 [Zootermopsis nevadensis]KDR20027.1 hypothetical protein L798_05262 [Zootermopsis nevadensis]
MKMCEKSTAFILIVSVFCVQGLSTEDGSKKSPLGRSLQGTGKVVPLGSGFGGIRNSPTEERGLEVSETGNYIEGKASLRSSLDVGQKSWKKIWPSQGRSRSVYVTSQEIAHLRRQAGDSGEVGRLFPTIDFLKSRRKRENANKSQVKGGKSAKKKDDNKEDDQGEDDDDDDDDDDEEDNLSSQKQRRNGMIPKQGFGGGRRFAGLPRKQAGCYWFRFSPPQGGGGGGDYDGDDGGGDDDYDYGRYTRRRRNNRKSQKQRMRRKKKKVTGDGLNTDDV